MKYDFTSIIDRRGMDSIAVDGIGHKVWGNEPAAPKEGFDSIPMWVADHELCHLSGHCRPL